MKRKEQYQNDVKLAMKSALLLDTSIDITCRNQREIVVRSGKASCSVWEKRYATVLLVSWKKGLFSNYPVDSISMTLTQTLLLDSAQNPSDNSVPENLFQVAMFSLKNQSKEHYLALKLEISEKQVITKTSIRGEFT